MKIPPLLLIGCLMSSPTYPLDQITIDGPATIAVNGPPTAIEIEGLPTGELSDEAWRLGVFPTQGCQLSPLLNWGERRILLCSASEPGRYSIVLTHAAPTGLVQVHHNLTTGLTPPNPDPPVPPPTPPTPPPTGDRWYVLIYESATDGQQVSGLLNSASFAQSLRDSGHTWIAHDRNAVDSSDAVPPSLKPYIEMARDAHPFLVIVSEAGDILWQGRCPKNPAEVLGLVPLTPKASDNAP